MIGDKKVGGGREEKKLHSFKSLRAFLLQEKTDVEGALFVYSRCVTSSDDIVHVV